MSGPEASERGRPWLWPLVLLVLFLGTVTMNLLWIAGDLGLGEGASARETIPQANTGPRRGPREDDTGELLVPPDPPPKRRPRYQPEEDLSDQPFGYVRVEFIPESLPPGSDGGEVRLPGRPYLLVEREGPRRFKVTARPGTRTGSARLCAFDSLGSKGCGNVGFDGETHVIRIGRLREVALTLLCDDCPDEVRCAGSHIGPACTGSAPDLSCRCLWEDAPVTGHTPQAVFDWAVDHERLGLIPEGHDAWTIDRRGDRGSIRARWAGPAGTGSACQAWLMEASTGGRVSDWEWCHEDPEVLFEDVRPGELVLAMGEASLGPGGVFTAGQDALSTVGFVRVDLRSGQDLDLGDIHPGQGADLYPGAGAASEGREPAGDEADTGGASGEGARADDADDADEAEAD